MKKSLKEICYSLMICGIIFSSGCGNGSVVIDVDLPINQASPFAELTTTPGATVFFQFDAMLPNPVTIHDIDASQTTVQFPSTDTSSPFLEPNKNSYDVSKVPLNPDTFYRVSMFGTLDQTSGVAKYKGVGDCPMKPSLGSGNDIRICFGLNTSTQTPLCPDTIAFTDCPK